MSFDGFPKHYRVASRCENCGDRPREAGQLSSDMFYKCPKCGYGLTSNPWARSGWSNSTFSSGRDIGDQEPLGTSHGLFRGYSFMQQRGYDSSKNRYYQRTYFRPNVYLPSSVWLVFLVVLVGLGFVAYQFVEKHGLEHVAFVTGAAVVIFALTTLALGSIMKSQRHDWLSSVVAPIAAALFALVFWSRLMDSYAVANFIDRLDRTYTNVTSVVITIISVFIFAWLARKLLGAFFGR